MNHWLLRKNGFASNRLSGRFFDTFIRFGTLALVLALGSAAQAQRSQVKDSAMPVVGKSTPIGLPSSSQVLHMAVSLQPRDPAGLQAFADAVSDPKSPKYRQYISPAQVGERFGATAQTQANVVNYLKSKGLKVTLAAPNRMAILVDGTVKQAEEAFGTKIRKYEGPAPEGFGKVQFIANESALTLPTNIAGSVIDVAGIESYTRPKAKNTQTLTPPLMRGLYNTLPLFNGLFHGQGRTVGISNFDGFRISDAILYINSHNLPKPVGGAASNVQVVTIDGGSGSGTPQGEGDLDLQMVLATAPLSNIIIYDGVSNLVSVLTKESTDNKADIITESWGWNLSMHTAAACHNQHLAMTAQGITYMEATGDFGTNLEPFTYSNYEPEVFQVGGTVATVADVTGIRVTEVGWSGSGGGWVNNAAPFNTRPSWQVGTGVPTNINRRLNPDVAFHADGNGGGFAVFVGGSQIGISGTSASSPMFAGFLAIAQQKLISQGKITAVNGKFRLGRIQNLIYQQNGRTDVYKDMTSGANGTLPDGTQSVCGPKWDFVTGFGAMDMNAFVNSFIADTTTAVAAATIATVQGTYQSGDLASVANSDDVRYSVLSYLINAQGNQAGPTDQPIDQVSSVKCDFDLDLSSGSLTNLKVNIESNASMAGVTGQIFGYNWSTGSFQSIAAYAVSTGDKTSALTIQPTTFSKFVDGTGNVRLMVRAVAPVRAGRTLPPAFTLNVDKISLSPVMSN